MMNIINFFTGCSTKEQRRQMDESSKTCQPRVEMFSGDLRSFFNFSKLLTMLNIKNGSGKDSQSDCLVITKSHQRFLKELDSENCFYNYRSLKFAHDNLIYEKALSEEERGFMLNIRYLMETMYEIKVQLTIVNSSALSRK